MGDNGIASLAACGDPMTFAGSAVMVVFEPDRKDPTAVAAPRAPQLILRWNNREHERPTASLESLVMVATHPESLIS